MERSEAYPLTDELQIRIPTAPIFLATKWDSFLDRGAGDYLGSHDLEDLITVVAGRPEVLEEIGKETEDVREFLAEMARTCVEEPQFDYALQGALPDVMIISGLLGEIRARFEQISSLVWRRRARRKGGEKRSVQSAISSSPPDQVITHRGN